MTHKLPANLSPGDEIDFAGYTSYKTQPVYLNELSNVRVSPNSVVYKNGILVDETVTNKELRVYFQIRHLVKKYLQGKTVKLDDKKKYLLITDMESSGHFHWFCEVLPKLIELKKFSKDFVLLLPDTNYIRKIGYDSLLKMEIEFADIVFMQPQNFYKIKNLYYKPSVSKGGLNDELLQAVHQQLIAGRENGEKKIFISRQKAAFRKIVNEEELIPLLQQYGFEILYGEDYSFAEQLDIFSSCNVLLGIHGAGLTNCFFMKKGSKVIELRKKENGTTNVGYWHLAGSLGHTYYYYNGVPDSDLPLVGRGCNLTIPLADFEQKILRPLEVSVK